MALQKFTTATNDNVTVGFNHIQKLIVVYDIKRKCESYFAGFENLKELFDEFFDNTTDDTSFEDAIKFFTTTIGQTFINKN